MNSTAHNKDNGDYKVVLVFHLKDGAADEELRRSAEPESFPRRLARQPGLVAIELIKLDDARTMSVQTWRSAKDWWTALDAVRGMPPSAPQREDILISRDFYGGEVIEAIV